MNRFLGFLASLIGYPFRHPLQERGKPIPAINLARMAEDLNQRNAMVKGGQTVPPGAFASCIQMEVVTVYPDYLNCKLYDGVETYSVIYRVAKPWLLRETPFNGETRAGITYDYSAGSDGQTREADDQTETENQTVIPSYEAGDVIYVFLGVSGGVDLYIPEEDDSDTPKVIYVDGNFDGRCWAKVAE